jgi:hypothetical protein
MPLHWGVPLFYAAPVQCKQVGSWAQRTPFGTGRQRGSAKPIDETEADAYRFNYAAAYVQGRSS